MMRTILAILVSIILTGCGNPGIPRLRPIKVHVHNIKPCGTFTYERKKQKLILNYKKALCLRRALKQCAEDRKKLIIANEENVKQMEALNEE